MNNSIKIDYKTIQKIGRSFSGKICLKLNDLHFPDENWNDFVYVIVFWWQKEIYEFITERKEEINLEFMDGPFCANGRKVQNSKIEFRLLKQGKSIVHVGTETIELSDITRSISKATQKLCEIAHCNNWSGNEIQDLVRMQRLLEEGIGGHLVSRDTLLNS